jgi:proteasome accessory factor C
VKPAERLHALHSRLRGARVPVSAERLAEHLGCSRATLMRHLATLRDDLGAPVRYDRERQGYWYDPDADGGRFELPGLWFSAPELATLLAAQATLEGVVPELLRARLAPLKDRLDRLLARGGVDPARARERVRLLPAASRAIAPRVFQAVTGALLERCRLELDYTARTGRARSERTVSPQRLVRWRDNWYLDAWCHARGALRSFALDGVHRARRLAAAALEVPEDDLARHYGASYGIFSGPAADIAVLRFTAQRACWVAAETWHPQQQGTHLADGRYELRVPYGDPRELVLDILRYGPDVEVLGPPGLRAQVAARLAAAAAQYRTARGSARRDRRTAQPGRKF